MPNRMQRRLSTPKFSALVGGGLAFFCIAIFMSGQHIKAREASPSVQVEPFEMPAETALGDDDEAAMAEAAGIETQPADDGGAVLPFDPDPLPADPQSRQPDVAQDQQGWTEKLLYRPTVSAAGRVEAQGYRIEINGVDPMDPAENCGEGANAWPCGAAARTQFRNMLRGRAVTCTVPEDAPTDVIATTCSVGGEDLGGWLVSQGWARAVEGGTLVELAEQARNGHRGVYGSKPVLPAIAVDITPPFEMQVQPALPAAPPSLENRGAFPPAPVLPGR